MSNLRKRQQQQQQQPHKPKANAAAAPHHQGMRKIKSLMLEVVMYVVLAIIALNLLGNLLDKIDTNDTEQQSISNPRDNDLVSDIQPSTSASDHHPTIKIDMSLPSGISASEYLSSSKYLQSLKFSSFQTIEKPVMVAGGAAKQGPDRNDIIYINSKLMPQKVFPIWSEAIENEVELFDIRIYINGKQNFNISNPRNKLIEPDWFIEGVRLVDDVVKQSPLSLSRKKLQRFANSLESNVYFHIYLYSRHGASTMENAAATFHKIIAIDNHELVRFGPVSLDDGKPELLINPSFSFTIINVQEIIDYPKLSDSMKQSIDLDVVNRRDAKSGTIGLFYPIIHLNRLNFKYSKFVPVIDDSAMVTLEFKISDSWSIFKIFIKLKDIFEGLISWTSNYRNGVIRPIVDLFNKGLVDILQIVYFFL
ncbi:hypothetical protein DASC09_050700 [Saccharomycopsis crataegensis]|uniref:Uncharacterized protein n=1 Tax=Saccharomycopsis crataegensis TaxID=43959 RepID=A0AAV5QU44_9ASCO|nr:hypothetical protein DASC09_050700 [Saccharomycopsis crataegensis]